MVGRPLLTRAAPGPPKAEAAGSACCGGPPGPSDPRAVDPRHHCVSAFRRPRSQRSTDGQCSGGPGYSGQERPARHWALVEFPFSHAAIHCIAASALTRNNAFPVAVSWVRQSLKKNLHRPRGLARYRLGGEVGGRFKRIGRVGNRTWVLLRLDHCGAPPAYREDELRRAFRRARTVENKAP